MKILREIACITAYFVMAVTLNASIIRVPSEQPTIQSAIDAAANSDTVLVAPAAYKVNLDFKGKSIYLTSEAGPLLTALKPYNTDLPIVSFENSESPLAVLDGFTLKDRYNKPAIQIYSSSPIIKNNIFTDNDAYLSGSIIYISGNASCKIERNLFYDNPDAYVVIWEDSDAPTWILNNTIYGGRQGLVLWGASPTAYGNIVTNCNMGVSAVSGANTAYNDIWGNGTDWSFGTAGALDISVNPGFVDSLREDFYLMDDSPLIDAGHPEAQYNDPDGTRNDIGAVPFDQRTPLALDLHLVNYEFSNILDHYPTFYWDYYDPVANQTAFELEVGTDKDWQMAESWASGEIASPDTFITYNGNPLENGSVNYYRVRVNNGTEWGIWKESIFRINSIPSSPIPVSPIDGVIVSAFGVRLSIENSIDNEGDELLYEFQIFSDAGLGTMVAEILDVAERHEITITEKIANLEFDAEYWWRCRAGDGYEYSVWSDPVSFVTRRPMTIRVPSEQPDIQAGIDSAEEQDTVLVAPDIYAGNGNRDIDFNGINIILISEAGPEQTIIDCGGSAAEPHQGFIFENNEDSTAEVNGFTITNSYAPMLWNSAAITCSSSPKVKNCIVSNNDGDGILCSSGASPSILDCIISDNTGAGIRCGWGNITVKNSLVYKNGEDGFYINYGAIYISNCTFAYNLGNGIILNGDPPKASARADDSAVIINCIAAYNGDAGLKQYFYYYPEIQIRCSDAFGNIQEDWGISEFGADDGFGNISENPLFCDGLGHDFSIADISPCAPANNDCGVLMGARNISCSISDVNDHSEIGETPENYSLGQNYPNPFNPSTVIDYSLPAQSRVKIIIYNLIGQEIKTIVDAEQAAGDYSITWNGTDADEIEVASGIYLYKIFSDQFVSSRKMIHLR